jgi:hypothetical protein
MLDIFDRLNARMDYFEASGVKLHAVSLNIVSATVLAKAFAGELPAEYRGARIVVAGPSALNQLHGRTKGTPGFSIIEI